MNKAFKNLMLPPVNFSTEEEWKVIKNESVGIKEIEAYIPIFQGGRMVYGYKKSEKEFKMSIEDLNITLYAWQEASVNEYFKALNFRKQREITDLTISALEKQFNRLDGLYQQNRLIARSEVLKVQADIENNKAINIENNQRERAAKETLLQLLGYELNKEIILKEFNVMNYVKTVGEIKKIQNPKETSLGKKQDLMVDIAEYNVKIAQADLYPAFYVKASHKFKERVGDRLVNRDEGMIEVGFRYRFEWGGTLDSVEQKKYALSQAKIRYTNNIQGIELEMRNKLGEIEAFLGQSEAKKRRVDLLKANLKIDNMRYDNGLVTTFEYLNSVNQLRMAEEDYYKLQRTLVLAVLEYENLFK